MHHSFLVENFSLTAAAVVFSFTLTYQPESAGAAFAGIALCAVPFAIVYFGYERVRLLRYRISRLGLYIMLREKVMSDRLGWEHFVYQFREIDMEEKAKRTLELYGESEPPKGPDNRARDLNSIVTDIDAHPGDFTASANKRWRLIIRVFIGMGSLSALLILYKWNIYVGQIAKI